MKEPTDKEIDELWDEIGMYYNLYDEVRNTVREALERWGNQVDVYDERIVPVENINLDLKINEND